MKLTSILLLSGFALIPVAARADGTPPAVAPISQPPAPDLSRDQVCGPLHVVIQKVAVNGSLLVVSGGMATNSEIDVTMFRFPCQAYCGATSLGGDPNLPCTTVTLGDNPDHSSPTISVVPGTTYPFSLTIKTHADSPTGLQELRIGMRFANQWQMLKFPCLKADASAQSPQIAAGDGAAPAQVANLSGGQQNPASVDSNNGGQQDAADNTPSQSGSGRQRNSAGDNSTPSPSDPAVQASDSNLPTPVTLADTAAEQIMNQLDTSISQPNWRLAATQVKQLEAVDKYGFQNTKLSDNLQPIVDDTCKEDSAKVQLATLAKPKTAAQYLQRASLELDAKEGLQAQMDLAILEKNVTKLNFMQQFQLVQDESRCVSLLTKGGN